MLGTYHLDRLSITGGTNGEMQKGDSLTVFYVGETFSNIS